MAGSYTKLLYHLVFSTKDRRQLIDSEIRERLFRYIGGILRGEDGALVEINGVADHVHLLLRVHPTMALSDAVRLIKSNSSKWVNETFKRSTRFAWQEGYAAFTVSHSQAARVINYIRAQEEHHRRADFRDEFRSLLTRHEIEFEERYLW